MSFRKKREDEFFLKFQEFADELKTMGVILAEITSGISDMEKGTEEMKKIEKECDIRTHSMLEKLHESFITPFDSADICDIAVQMDDIADYMEETANKLLVYDIRELTEEAAEISSIVKDACCYVSKLFGSLAMIKRKKEAENETMNAVIEINRLENIGDEMFCSALTKLFMNGTDPIAIIKWKDIYASLENTLDACEALADTVRGVLVKNA